MPGMAPAVDVRCGSHGKPGCLPGDEATVEVGRVARTRAPEASLRRGSTSSRARTRARSAGRARRRAGCGRPGSAAGSSRHSSTERGMWSEPGITPVRERSSCDRVSMSRAPVACASSAASGSSRSSRLRASRRRSSIVVRGPRQSRSWRQSSHAPRRTTSCAATEYPRPSATRSIADSSARVLERLDLAAVVAHEVVVVVASRRERARSARPRRRDRPAGRARARPCPSSARYTLAIPTRPPRARTASWISCADRQQSCSPRSSTTRRRAPPLRPLASRSRVSAVSVQARHGDNDTRSQRRATVHRVRTLLAAARGRRSRRRCGRVRAATRSDSRADGRRRASIRSPGWRSRSRRPEHARRQPHACRVPSRTTSSSRRGTSRRSATPTSSSTSAEASSPRSRMPSTSRDGPVARRPAARGERSARLARSGPVRADAVERIGAASVGTGCCSYDSCAPRSDSTRSTGAASPTATGTRSSRATPRSATSQSATGSTQLALAGRSPEAEPSPRDLERLVDEVRDVGRDDGVRGAARLAPSSPRRSRARRGSRSRRSIRSRGLSKERLAAGEDYLSVMRANLATLREALGCR